MIIRLYRYLRGTVLFRCEGAMCERFLNLATAADIKLFDLEKQGLSLTARVRAEDYKRLRAIAKRSMVRMRIVKKRGLPFLVFRHRFRYGLLIGLFAVAALTVYLSGSVLSIRVEGNVLVATEDILEVLSSKGIYLFARKEDIPFRQIEQTLTAELPHLSWVGFSVNGTTVTVSVKERTLAPTVVPADEPCDIVASEGGVVKEIRALRGEARVAVGDGVIAGQQLIGGVLGDTVGNVTLVHADGTVLLEVQRALSVSADLKQTVKTYEESYTVKSLYIGSFRIPLGGSVPEQAETYTVREPFYLLGFATPVQMETVYVDPYTEEEVEYTQEQLKEQLLAELEQQERLQLYDVKVTDKKVYFEETASGLTLHGEYTCEKEVGQEQKISLS